VSAPHVAAPSHVAVQPRPVHMQPAHAVPQPTHVQAPVNHERYYDYYEQPAVVVENHAPRAGYDWVAGSWSWNGGEWIWGAGHYQPVPSHVVSHHGAGHGY